MKIHDNIRKRRRELGYTQEQLALRLGVSPPAVNKWERGVSCPDISLLPALARLLETDINSLLSFEEELTEKELSDFINSLSATGFQQGAEQAYSMGAEKIRQYPNCHGLLLYAAMVIDGIFVMNDNKGGPDYSAEIEEWYTRAAQSGDNSIKNQANSRLVTRYMNSGEYEKAQALLDGLPPEPPFDKRQLQASLYMKQGRLAEAAKLIESGLVGDASNLQTSLLTLVDVAQKENRPADAEYIANVAVMISEQLDMSEFTTHALLYQQALINKDADTLMEVLEILLPGLLKPWKIKASPLYRHLPQKEMDMGFGLTILKNVLKDMEDEHIHEFDFVKDRQDFKELIVKYKAKLL